MVKPKSSSWKRDRSPPDDIKPKRAKTPSETSHKKKAKQVAKSLPRKTRWQAAEEGKVPSETAPISEPAAKKEKSSPPPRIKDLLNNKEKIVDLLFQTVTGAALQELIPDYLKTHTNEELKKLCIEEINAMSDELILQCTLGKVDSSNKEEKPVEKEKILKPEQPSSLKENEGKEITLDSEKKVEASSKDSAGTLPDNSPHSEVATTTNAENMEYESKEIPLVIKDEVAKDLILPERDAELLELEMRARAIRALLKKAKGIPSREENEPAGEMTDVV